MPTSSSTIRKSERPLRRSSDERLAKREQAKADGKVIPLEEKPVTLEDVAVDLERKRLFQIIEELVQWENSTNEEVLERARAEIRRSCNGELPPVYDPFSGGGSIPLEAQRLGLPAYGSDLNPVAVMIGKAMIEIPPKFKDQPPDPSRRQGTQPLPQCRRAGRGREILRRMDARESMGAHRPPLPAGRPAEGVWRRQGHSDRLDMVSTVPSPDPAFSGGRADSF